MKPIMTEDLSPAVQVSAARLKTSIRASMRDQLLAKEATRDLSAEQIAEISEAAAEACMAYFLAACTVNVTVNITPKA